MKDNLSKFDEIRPYNDAEAVKAFRRIAESDMLPEIVSKVFPSKSAGEVRQYLDSFSCIDEFQKKMMIPAAEFILKKTTNGLTCSGIENIKDGKTHVFLSGHRDIILDPAFIELTFFRNGVPVSEIAVGDNLLGSQMIKDLMFSNRMIKVVRSGSTRDKYLASLLLSEYIRMKVVGNERSVWIAHRGGRTKDGNDLTGQGVLKMLSMCNGKEFVKSYRELRIIPISISYEIEPCDFLKTIELYLSKQGPYIKSEGEDLNSMLTGIFQPKGRVHIHFSPVVSEEEIESCEGIHTNERITELRYRIDKTIQKNFKLWPNNFIASDILSQTDKYSERYSAEEKEWFAGYMERGLDALSAKYPSADKSELKNIFLSIYSNPVKNREALLNII